MSANIEIIQQQKDSCLTVPVEAIITQDNKNFVLVPDPENSGSFIHKIIITGMKDTNDVEILKGLSPDDLFAVKEQSDFISTKKSDKKTNPFMPQRKKK